MFDSLGALIAVLAAVTLPTIGIAVLLGRERARPAGLGAIAVSGIAVPGAVVAFVLVYAGRKNGVGYGDAMGLAVVLMVAATLTPVTLFTAFLVIKRINKRRNSSR